MRELACSRVLDRIAEDGDARNDEVRAHLADCAPCRHEAGELLDALALLARTAEVTPPRALDRAVRRALDRSPAPTRPATELRPFLALGLAVAGLLALGSGTAAVLAQSGAAERGPLLAAVALWAYLAISSTASLPLLLLRRNATTRREVHR